MLNENANLIATWSALIFFYSILASLEVSWYFIGTDCGLLTNTKMIVKDRKPHEKSFRKS